MYNVVYKCLGHGIKLEGSFTLSVVEILATLTYVNDSKYNKVIYSMKNEI